MLDRGFHLLERVVRDMGDEETDDDGHQEPDEKTDFMGRAERVDSGTFLGNVPGHGAKIDR
jgi:hypothetical protein